MTGHRQYKITDFRFGLAVVTLREKVRLTQKDVADALNVSRRTIQHWEAGTAFPDTHHLKNLIAFFLTYGAFTKEHEKEESSSLWEQADESATRRRIPFDHVWFDDLFSDISSAKSEKAAIEKKQWPLDTSIDWHDAPDVREIYGRDGELQQLKKWILEQESRFVVVLGMGGIGKTTLSTKFAQEVSSEFEYVIWRSLQNAPPLEQILLECIQVLAPANTSKPTVKNLLDLMQKHRCLIVLDNMETIHKRGTLTGEYREGYEEYQTLFLQLAKCRHKSCVLLTSREIPVEIEPLEGEQGTVRVMRLTGLSWQACQSMLQDKGLFGSAETWGVFVHYYAGNPLGLKIAASTIRQLFGGDLNAFLTEAPVTLHTLQNLLDNQFESLSSLEREIMFWLAIEREPVTLVQLRDDMVDKISRNALLMGLISLRQRSLIERGDIGAIFYLQPVLLEYTTNQLVSYVSDDIEEQNLTAITKFPLMKSKTVEHIRESQQRMILMPTIERLLDALDGPENLANHLRVTIRNLKAESFEHHGFAGGNLVNMLIFLNGHIKDEDFSDLSLRQVYMQGVEAQNADFSNVEFTDSHFTEPIETIGAMALSPKGTYLAASSYSGQVHVWLVDGVRPLWTVSGAQREWALAFSPDETLLASGGFSGEVCLWNTSNGKLLNKVAGHRVWVFSVAFQSDGKRLATGGFYGSVRVWNTQDMSLERTLEGHTSSIASISFGANDTRLVTSSRDGSIRIWDLSNGECLHILRHGEDGVWIKASIHPNGSLLASCSEEDPFIKFWDIYSGECLATINTQSMGSASMAFDLDGEIFARGDNDGGIGLWRMEPILSPQYLGTLSGHPHAIEPVSFAERGMLATYSIGESIRLWDTRSGRLLSTIQGYSRLIGGTAFTPDKKWLVQGDANGRIRIWDLESQQYIHNFQAHSGSIWKIGISSDGRKLVSTGDDKLVKLWDLKDMKCLKTFSGHLGRIFSMTISPNNKLIASGSTDRLIRVWSADADNILNPVQNFEGTFDQVWSLAFDPTSTLLASGHLDGEIHLWDVKNGERVRVLHQEANTWGDLVGKLRFSSDGKYLFSSSANELLRRWDITTGECLVIHSKVLGNRNSSIEISRDGKFVITGSGESQICYWTIDAENDARREPERLSGHNTRVWTVAVSSDEQLLASSDEEGLTIITDLNTREILQHIYLDRPYERMKIKGVKGLNPAERSALSVLGGIE